MASHLASLWSRRLRQLRYGLKFVFTRVVNSYTIEKSAIPTGFVWYSYGCGSGAHDSERVTSTRSCHGVFTDQCIFRTVLARILNIF